MTAHENYFTCIGGQKCGTTWLHSYLRFNTSAQMPVIKEFHWFDNQLKALFGQRREKSKSQWNAIQERVIPTGRPFRKHHKQYRDYSELKTDADYRAFFENHCDPDSVFGDITPSYSRLDRQAFTRIKQLFPKTKMVFLLRNPADRLWSSINMRVQRHPDTDANAELDRRLAVPLSGSRSDYQRTYEEAVSVVGREQMFVAYHEDIFGANQARVLGDLCAFLQIKGFDLKPETLRDNRRTYAPLPDQSRQRVLAQTLPTYHWAEAQFGRVPENWRQDVRNYKCTACQAL